MRPRLLDLFCHAGGAAAGYAAAGFDVVGVDLDPQPNYPFEFHQADALTFPTDGFDAVHASPPCQRFTALRHRHPNRGHPDLVAPTRDRLIAAGVPWVIENVPGAPLRSPVVLCGSMFGLGAAGRQLRRHRLFESSVLLWAPCPCRHRGLVGGVYGDGGAWQRVAAGGGGYKFPVGEAREAMGMTWGTRSELAQAIPPAYTEWIGRLLLAQIAHPITTEGTP